ncbi:MAG: hypothetical protein P4L53_08215 [Candidatus Obscuribacterales bacterium]|nr:hypothetical protein [Candidatus Obscuribacterales bacterium]
MRALLMFFNCLLTLTLALPSSANQISGTTSPNNNNKTDFQAGERKTGAVVDLHKDTILHCVLERAFDSTKTSTGDQFLLVVPEGEVYPELEILPDATKFQGTIICFSDPTWAHVKFVALKLERILFPDGRQEKLPINVLAWRGRLYRQDGKKVTTYDSFITPKYEIDSAVLLGSSGGAPSKDLLNKSRKICPPKELQLPDGTIVLIVRGHNKVNLLAGAGVRLQLWQDLQI